MILIIWTIALVSALVLYLKRVYSRFSPYGVKSHNVVPFLGNITPMLIQTEHIAETLDRLYKNYAGDRFVGKYDFTTPNLVMRDLELIKKITIKDFEHFLDRRGFADDDFEPMFARNLFVLTGEEWKNMRSTISPAFTSSKIRLMVPFMEEVGKQMVVDLMMDIKKCEAGYTDVDCKDLTARFANDVIATCVFGLKVDSLKDKSNKFYEASKNASSFTWKGMLKIFFSTGFPFLAKKLRLQLFTDETRRFFLDSIIGTMKEREARGIVRPDLIHLLMQAKKGKLAHDEKSTNDADAGYATVQESSIGKQNSGIEWSDIDLVAQAVIFFLAGFESISVAMSFALYELALNPDIQERLANEIKESDLNSNGKLDYTAILNMKYLDMVVTEVLRIWPPTITLDRLCVKDYNLGKANDEAVDYIIRKGESINIPVWCIHRDAKYFPDPLKFDPERFSDENKHLIHPMAYMPFGIGPRNCIGSRFALWEFKVLIYMLMLNFEVSPYEKTCTARKISKKSFQMRLQGGHWLRFKPRQ